MVKPYPRTFVKKILRDFWKINDFYMQKSFFVFVFVCDFLIGIMSLLIGSVALLSVERSQVFFGIMPEGCLTLCGF